MGRRRYGEPTETLRFAVCKGAAKLGVKEAGEGFEGGGVVGYRKLKLGAQSRRRLVV